MNLFGSDETPYESLHALISSAMKPYFEAFAAARGGGKDGDGKMGESPHATFSLLPLSHGYSS